MPKKIGRRFGESNSEGGNNDPNSGSDKDVLLRLKDMAQEILNLQTTIAVRQQSEPAEVMSQSDQHSSVSSAGVSSSTANQQQNQSTKEGRLIRRASAKMQSPSSTPSMEEKIQQLSQLRYELSSELEVSLQNLQQVMQKSQDIVSEMNEILKQQVGDKQT